MVSCAPEDVYSFLAFTIVIIGLILILLNKKKYKVYA